MVFAQMLPRLFSFSFSPAVLRPDYMIMHLPLSAQGLFFLSGACISGSVFSFSSTYSLILEASRSSTRSSFLLTQLCSFGYIFDYRWRWNLLRERWMVLRIEKTKYLLMIECTKLKTKERKIMKKYNNFQPLMEWFRIKRQIMLN